MIFRPILEKNEVGRITRSRVQTPRLSTYAVAFVYGPAGCRGKMQKRLSVVTRATAHAPYAWFLSTARGEFRVTATVTQKQSQLPAGTTNAAMWRHGARTTVLARIGVALGFSLVAISLGGAGLLHAWAALTQRRGLSCKRALLLPVMRGRELITWSSARPSCAAFPALRAVYALTRGLPEHAAFPLTVKALGGSLHRCPCLVWQLEAGALTHTRDLQLSAMAASGFTSLLTQRGLERGVASRLLVSAYRRHLHAGADSSGNQPAVAGTTLWHLHGLRRRARARVCLTGGSVAPLPRAAASLGTVQTGVRRSRLGCLQTSAPVGLGMAGL